MSTLPSPAYEKEWSERHSSIEVEPKRLKGKKEVSSVELGIIRGFLFSVVGEVKGGTDDLFQRS